MSKIVKKTIQQEVFEYAGANYPSWDEAAAAQRKAENNVEKYFSHHQFNAGISQARDHVAYWKITDEGPVDFGASGGPRILAYVHGTLLKAVQLAVTIPNFWGYGPGMVIEIEVKEL